MANHSESNLRKFAEACSRVRVSRSNLLTHLFLGELAKEVEPEVWERALAQAEKNFAQIQKEGEL